MSKNPYPSRHWKYEVPPDRCTVLVTELLQLWKFAALLEALKRVGVKDWVNYDQAEWLVDNEPDLKDIALGWKKLPPEGKEE